MARRIVEEDVSTPTSTTVLEGDGSWVGRTIVSLVLIAVLVLGAIWLFNNVGDGDGGTGDNKDTTNNVDIDNPDVDVNVPNDQAPADAPQG